MARYYNPKTDEELRQMTDQTLRQLASANSQNWHSADEGEQGQLHDQNVAINRILDSRTGSQSGFDAASGRWNVTGGNAQQPKTSTSGYWDQLNAGLDAYRNRAPYQSPFQSDIDALYNQITNRDPFSYDYRTDPQWQSYKKQYTREGQRAAADAMGQYATMTGGMPSTAAVAASQQASDYYNAQMTDKIPELYRAAYSMYQDEGDNMRAALNTLLQRDATEYSRYMDEGDALRQSLATMLQMQQLQNDEANTAYQQEYQAQQDADARQRALAQLGWETGDYGYLGTLGITPNIGNITSRTIADSPSLLRQPSNNPQTQPDDSKTKSDAKEPLPSSFSDFKRTISGLLSTGQDERAKELADHYDLTDSQYNELMAIFTANGYR